ncbi:hypothetical protein SAICODRAFT_30927 [Saitoella complicata NRRL Y-17804]|nr:uncharacterized protein SAICODRAFT_30927 [Saitoella complicata NRRL Y-17804]ODQ52175.1 hypothetical protein SAICODRAFT_30927 [Saitoella complicata NRRL Y-17804]
MALVLSAGDRYMDQTFIVNESIYRTEYGDDGYVSPILATLPALYRVEGVAKDYLLRRMSAALNTCLATANMDGSSVAVHPLEKSSQDPQPPVPELCTEGERACSAPVPSVAIAGWLLGYPVIYWPTEGESSALVLSGAQLRVWHVGVRKRGEESVAMQWSCPEWLHTATEAGHDSTRLVVWEELDRRHTEIGERWRRKIGELENGCWELRVLEEWTGRNGRGEEGVILGNENRVQYGINL